MADDTLTMYVTPQILKEVAAATFPVVEVNDGKGGKLTFVRKDGARASQSIETNARGWPVRKWQGNAL